MSDTEEQATETREVTAEELLGLLKASELRSADRLVFLRSFEKFYNTVNEARAVLVNDMTEINNAISMRNQGVIPSQEDASSEEE